MPSLSRRLQSCLCLLLLVGLSACARQDAPAEPVTLRFSVVANAEVVGSLVGVTDASRVEVDYRVDDNGRGPKHHESIVIGDQGIPLSWKIDGTSLMGGPVAEDYRWDQGVARWTSQADAGERKAPVPALYVVNDGSPWAIGVYARALLQAPGLRLDAVPGGRLQLERLQDEAVGSGDALVTTTVYRLTGVDLQPVYLLLDAQQQLFAVLPGSLMSGALVVREGYESHGEQFQALVSRLGMERAEQLQQQLAHRSDGPVTIRNVHVFDPVTATRGPRVTVTLDGGRIAAITPYPGAPPDTVPAGGDSTTGLRGYDGEGGTLVPGLHDMHSHSTLDSGLWYLAAGVTATRDMGNDNAFLMDLMTRIDAGTVAGPRIVRNGFLEGRSPYSARTGIVADTLDEALEAVRWYAANDYWQIKIYNSLNPDWVKPVAAEAHRLGMGVTGHVPAFSSPDRVIGDGYDEIAHLNQLMLGWLLEPQEDTRTPLRLTGMARAAGLDLALSPKVQATIALMKQHDTALDTTAVILELLMLSRAGDMSPGGEYFLDHMPIGYQRYRKRTYVSDLTEQGDKDYHLSVERMLATIKLLHDNGLRLLPGTDDGTGFTLHRELELYAKSGIPAGEVLRIATLDMARYMGQDKTLGSIDVGKQADFFLVAGDPTRDINAVRKARLVSKGDAIYFPSEIYEALGVRPFADAPRPLR
jgi:imidazolonepropionase-like amidohydrolase